MKPLRFRIIIFLFAVLLCLAKNPLFFGADPTGFMTLDATRHVENGKPWLVYCHEDKGAIEAILPKDDLSETIGKPVILLSAAEFDGKLPLVLHRYFQMPATRVQI